ncbi:PhzF family phenazine biosynthesis protein [Rubrimonas cliftonensis]|uniref:Phenazine biosynthesis protein PhzF family n=1 Tax=Rubrimonas cliftonensis TaxID=89524 RepID=A0A1H4F9C3_9RHOB|nr:PhzF family phenazine biosynthesis protein [Rubrimonas cliftonensis]SEA93500.1 phenazine biosynthesis protein PhzF family [Rubrimonas cliftonensis]
MADARADALKVRRIAAFTRDGRGGNPAGVVLAETLPDAATMQAVAAEVGYSETAFAAPAEDGWRVRYFSPETEIPFCGHATIALGAALAQAHGAGAFPLLLRNGRIEVEAGMRDGAWRAVLRSPPTRSAPAPGLIVAEALDLFGYDAGALDPTLPPALAHAGADHLIVALAAREALAAMAYDFSAGRDFMRRCGLTTVAFVHREAERSFQARNAFAGGGVVEDPATGAAAAALAGMLRDLGALAGGELVVLQGEDMGRPSRIEVSFTSERGASVSVGGACADIACP